CKQVGDVVEVALARYDQAIFNLLAHEWERAQAVSAEIGSRAISGGTGAVVAHHFAGLLTLAVGDHDRAGERFSSAQVALGGVPTATAPFFTPVTVCWVVDDRGPVPLPIGEDSMLLGRRVGAEQARGHIELAMAVVERLSGRIDDALAVLADATDRFAAVDDAYGQAFAAGQRGHTLRLAGDGQGRPRSFDEAEALRVSVRDVRAIAMTTAGRSVAEALIGRTTDARRGISDMVEWMRRTGDVPGTAFMLHNAAVIELVAGEAVR